MAAPNLFKVLMCQDKYIVAEELHKGLFHQPIPQLLSPDLKLEEIIETWNKVVDDNNYPMITPEAIVNLKKCQLVSIKLKTTITF